MKDLRRHMDTNLRSEMTQIVVRVIIKAPAIRNELSNSMHSQPVQFKRTLSSKTKAPCFTARILNCLNSKILLLQFDRSLWSFENPSIPRNLKYLSSSLSQMLTLTQESPTFRNESPALRIRAQTTGSKPLKVTPLYLNNRWTILIKESRS